MKSKDIIGFIWTAMLWIVLGLAAILCIPVAAAAVLVFVLCYAVVGVAIESPFATLIVVLLIANSYFGWFSL